jgi:hypothetical protein
MRTLSITSAMLALSISAGLAQESQTRADFRGEATRFKQSSRLRVSSLHRSSSSHRGRQHRPAKRIWSGGSVCRTFHAK